MYETVREAVENRDFKKVKELFTQLNEADIADLIQGFHDNQEVDARDISLLFRLLPKDMAAEVFTYMDSDMKELLINSFTDTELQKLSTISLSTIQLTLSKKCPRTPLRVYSAPPILNRAA